MFLPPLQRVSTNFRIQKECAPAISISGSPQAPNHYGETHSMRVLQIRLGYYARFPLFEVVIRDGI